MDVRKELGCIMYAANVLSSRGPRKMQAFLPRVDEHNNVSTWRPLHKDEEMVAKAKRRIMKDLQYLINKPPRWNDQVGAYVLNFNGRVTVASVKNFQLVDPEDQNTVTLQVGAKCSLALSQSFCWFIVWSRRKRRVYNGRPMADVCLPSVCHYIEQF